MTYEAVTLIIEHYNITMNVSSAMYHTMIDSDICIMITITTITVIGTMWIISCPKYIITSNSHSVRRVPLSLATSTTLKVAPTDDIFFECTKILQIYFWLLAYSSS